MRARLSAGKDIWAMRGLLATPRPILPGKTDSLAYRHPL